MEVNLKVNHIEVVHLISCDMTTVLSFKTKIVKICRLLNLRSNYTLTFNAFKTKTQNYGINFSSFISTFLLHFLFPSVVKLC